MNKEETVRSFKIQQAAQAPTHSFTAVLFVHTKHSYSCLYDRRSQPTSGLSHSSGHITNTKQMFHMQTSTCQGRAVSLMSDKSSRSFLGQRREGEIRQEVGVVGDQAGRSWRAAIGEKEVAGNVGFSGGGVGRGSLSILQSTSSEGARSSYENKSQHVGCLKSNYSLMGGRRRCCNHVYLENQTVDSDRLFEPFW